MGIPLVSGVVEWPALIAIVSVIIVVTLGVSGFACTLLIMAWNKLGAVSKEASENLARVAKEASEALAETRHAIRSEISQARIAIEHEVSEVKELVGRETKALDERLRRVETEHVLVMALRQDFREFQASIEQKLEQSRNERREDIRGIHSRLNDLIMVPARQKESGE